MTAKMPCEERLTKARIKLQSRNPFFSYLSFFITLRKAKQGELPEYAGMGVNEKGNLIYSEEFVDKLTDEELIGVLCHEIMHLALLHLLRRGSRVMQGWNIACDLTTNAMLVKDNFELPKGCLVPERYTDAFKEGGLKIENVSQKTAEEIYDELPNKMKEGNGNGGGNGIGKGWRFDEHQEGKDGQPLSESEKNALENEWANRMEEAYVSAKNRGQVPCGLERYIGELRKSQVSWKTLLQKYIVSEIPSDYTWAKRGKKSNATGVYLPDTIKEKINVVIGIDTSGSIGKEELTEFISEIIGISKAYSSAMDMRLFTHDCEVHNDYMVRNGSIEKIKNLKIEGGGGTSHEPVFETIKTKVKDCKVAVFFTDGDSDLTNLDFEKYHFKKIFIISKNGNDNQLEGKNCIKVKLK